MSSTVKLPRMLIKNLKLRNFTQNRHDWMHEKNWQYTLRKLVFEWSGFNKYGLYAHDVIDYDDPVVKEALRRIPEEVLDARNFRIIRALHLSFLKTYLPKEKWVTFEEDLEYRYLGPYIKEIEAEQAERNEFDYND